MYTVLFTRSRKINVRNNPKQHFIFSFAAVLLYAVSYKKQQMSIKPRQKIALSSETWLFSVTGACGWCWRKSLQRVKWCCMMVAHSLTFFLSTSLQHCSESLMPTQGWLQSCGNNSKSLISSSSIIIQEVKKRETLLRETQEPSMSEMSCFEFCSAIKDYCYGCKFSPTGANIRFLNWLSGLFSQIKSHHPTLHISLIEHKFLIEQVWKSLDCNLLLFIARLVHHSTPPTPFYLLSSATYKHIAK